MSNETEEIRVLPQDDIEIRYTTLAKFNAPGSTAKVHRMHAEKLVSAGKAEYTDGPAKTKKGGKE